jgi:glutathione S-transferase
VSQPARAVKVLIDIGKITCKFNNIDLFKLEQKKANYLSINPMGTVPTLVHNNIKITESIAILAYLC